MNRIYNVVGLAVHRTFEFHYRHQKHFKNKFGSLSIKKFYKKNVFMLFFSVRGGT